MSGFAILVMSLLAAEAASPVVPLVGEPASASPATAGPRVLVCLPKGSAALEPQVARAFSWAALTTISPDTVARRFPPSAASRAVGDDERRLDELVRAAEAAFLALKFDDATAHLDEAGTIIDRLPPSARHEAAYVRVQLLQGRVAQARGNARAAEAFARAGDAAVDVELDEADYPPAVRQAYKAARAAARARPRRSVELASEPPGRGDRSQRPARGTDAGEAVAAAGALLSVAHPRRFQALPRRVPIVRPRAHHRDAGARRPRRAARSAARPHRGRSRLVPRAAAARHAGRRGGRALDRRARSRPGPRAQGAGVLRRGARAEARRAVAPARHRARQAVGGGARPRAARAAPGGAGRRYAEGVPALEARAGDPGLGSAVAFVRRKGSADYPAARPGGARGRAVLGRAAVAARQRRRLGRRVLRRGARRQRRGRLPRGRRRGAAAFPAHGDGDRRRARRARRAGTCGRRSPSSPPARPRPASTS